jgi:AraC-like DNA-binding protein
MPIHIATQKSREACLRALPLEAGTGNHFPDTGTLQSSGSFSSLLFYDDHCPDFCIRLSHYFIGSHKGTLQDCREDTLLALQFVLQDSLHYTLEDGSRHTMAEGQYNLIASPSVRKISWFDPANTHVGTLDIHLSASYLEKLSGDFPGLRRLLEKRDQGMIATLSEAPATVDPVMLHFLNAIISCPHTGELRRTYMQTKVFLLMVVALEQILSRPVHKETLIPLNRHEVEKIYEARQYMRQHMENPPTVKELARKMGMNDFKLKKAYKQVFHTTIFGDFNDVRMDKARQYLLQTDQTIADISLSTGYEDPPNFIRAFKAHFGTPPSHFRKLHGYLNNKHLL